MRRRLGPLGRDDPAVAAGYFTRGIIPSGNSPGGAHLGAAVIRITG
jgi:hypothetical protein